MVDQKKERLFSIGQVALQSGVEIKTVRRWINRGHLKANDYANYISHCDGDVLTLDDFIYFLKETEFEPIVQNIKKESDHPRVLIIEDELNVAKSIGRIFAKNGIEVLTAENGFKASYLLNHLKPQILTLDLNMKDLNGHDVLKVIQELKIKHKLWVIIISGDSKEKLEKAIDLGADFYLQKPFLKKDLEKIIHKFYPEKKELEKDETPNTFLAS